MHHSLLGTLMDIPSFGGLVVTTAEGREIEKVHLPSLNSFLNQQILNQIKNPTVLILS